MTYAIFDTPGIYEIPGIKESHQPRDVLVFGSGTLAAALTRVGLIDEYRIVVCPTIVGQGARLLADTIMPTLHLVSVVAVSSGAAVLNYSVASKISRVSPA